MGRHDCNFLPVPIQLRTSLTRLRTDQSVYPRRECWKKNFVASLRLIARGPGPERHNRAATKAVSSDRVGQMADTELGDGLLQVNEFLEYRITLGHLTDGFDFTF